MAEEPTLYNETRGFLDAWRDTSMISTYLDPQKKQNAIAFEDRILRGKILNGEFKENKTNPRDAAEYLREFIHPGKFVVNTDGPVNYWVYEDQYKRFDLDPNLALNGSNSLIGWTDENKGGWAVFKELGDDFQKVMAETELKEIRSTAESMGILHGKEMEDYIREQVTQDLIDGNSYNLKRALIHNSNGKGYRIGIFFIPEDGSKKDGILIGAMLDGDKFRDISEEELVGASASGHVLDYVLSNYFDRSHKNINNLYREGLDNNDKDYWKNPRVSDWAVVGPLISYFEEMGELEFKYAIKPLADMMEKEASKKYGNKYKPGIDFLSDEQSKEVLKSYIDRHERFFKSDYVPDWVRPHVRNISNWWSVDMKVRELRYED